MSANDQMACVNKFVAQQRYLSVLEDIRAEVEAKRNSPQELWASWRGFAVANCAMSQSGLLRDVEEFCFAVFDCLEPNISQEVREQRRIHVGALAVPLNLRIVEDSRQLTAKGNAFLVKWGIVTGTIMIALRQPNPNIELILSPFSTFDQELKQVDQPESVLAVWLYSLYTTIYTSAFGTIPAGVLGVASLGVGLAMAGR